jgi:hypothetical protein
MILILIKSAALFKRVCSFKQVMCQSVNFPLTLCLQTNYINIYIGEMLTINRGFMRIGRISPKTHDGTIITAQPDFMWRTDPTTAITREADWAYVLLCNSGEMQSRQATKK